MSQKDVSELLDSYMDQNNLHRTEGRSGVTNLCQVARAIGYRDPAYFGQLTSNAAIGDLICFLEDNPGAIEAIYNWIRDNDSPEVRENLEEVVNDEDEDQD